MKSVDVEVRNVNEGETKKLTQADENDGDARDGQGDGNGWLNVRNGVVLNEDETIFAVAT